MTQSDVADADREYMLGQSLELQQRYAESTEHYLKAIRLRPEHIRWRYELALLFERQGALDRAHEQIKWCVRTATGNRQYQAMLNRINRALLEKQKS